MGSRRGRERLETPGLVTDERGVLCMRRDGRMEVGQRSNSDLRGVDDLHGWTRCR
jgi:hypothetical protein